MGTHFLGAGPLDGVRVIEAASFVAGPFAGLAMHQLGADVIRVDPPGGGSDLGRWPLSTTGASLFWANLNRGKKSVTIDHRRPEGRELLLALATVAGPNTGCSSTTWSADAGSVTRTCGIVG